MTLCARTVENQLEIEDFLGFYEVPSDAASNIFDKKGVLQLKF